MIGSLVDRAMDVTVAPGYSRIGYGVRSAMGWERPPADALRGRTVVITGATSGLGLAAASAICGLGAEVHVLARDERRGRAAAERIAAAGTAPVYVQQADLSSIASARAAARRFVDAHGRLDVLINDAGVLLNERSVSVDGHETTFATNVLGMFVLTNELLPALVVAAPSRVITVSSGGMYAARLDPENLESDQGAYRGADAYARSKRAEVVLTEVWSARLRRSGVAFHAMHPGWADTPGVRESLPTFYRLTRPLLRTPAQGADTIVWLAWAPEGARSTGLFWHDRRPRPTRRLPAAGDGREDHERLWRACVEACGPNSVASEALLAE